MRLRGACCPGRKVATIRKCSQEVEGEEDMPTSAKSLLQRLRTHGRRYCGGRPLPAAGAVEQCERELDIQKEEDQNVEACKVCGRLILSAHL